MATTKSAKKDEQLRLRKELSEKAVAFYAQHNVSQTLEKLLNQMFVAAPNDVYGYMVRSHVHGLLTCYTHAASYRIKVFVCVGQQLCISIVVCTTIAQITCTCSCMLHYLRIYASLSTYNCALKEVACHSICV